MCLLSSYQSTLSQWAALSEHLNFCMAYFRHVVQVSKPDGVLNHLVSSGPFCGLSGLSLVSRVKCSSFHFCSTVRGLDVYIPIKITISESIILVSLSVQAADEGARSEMHPHHVQAVTKHWTSEFASSRFYYIIELDASTPRGSQVFGQGANIFHQMSAVIHEFDFLHIDDRSREAAFVLRSKHQVISGLHRWTAAAHRPKVILWKYRERLLGTLPSDHGT